MLRRMITTVMLFVAAIMPGLASGTSENAIATGTANFGDGASITLNAVGFASGLVQGTVAYRPQPGADIVVIALDCMAFTPGGNVTTIGGDLYASGVDSLTSQRFYLRITDQFGDPGRFGAFVAVSTTAGTETSQCLAEDLRGVAIGSGDFLFVRPA